MNRDEFYRLYQDLQRYVGWTESDVHAVQYLRVDLEPHLHLLIDDFYAEIDRHEQTRKVIVGGKVQIERLKNTLHAWLGELLRGPYDLQYVQRRWQVGWRHVEIGLDQSFAHGALARLRQGLVRLTVAHGTGPVADLHARIISLHKLLDLDLAIIDNAYQSVLVGRLQQQERQLAELQQRELTLAKRRSDAALGALLQSAPCFILIVRPNRSILYVSRFAEQIGGYPSEEVLHRDFLALFMPPDLRSTMSEKLDQVIQGVPCAPFESRVACRHDVERDMFWNFQVLDDYESGLAVLVIGHDITSLKRAQNQALQSERLAAIGQMMTGLAHESGNALARSQACLEMLALEVEDRPRAMELIQRIQAAQEHLQQLYNEVRGYAAPIKLDREPCSVAIIWRQAWNHLATLRAGKKAELIEQTAGIDLQCNVGVFRIEQVFRNILENALTACGSAPRIEVTCSVSKRDAQSMLRISFHDNGPGLTAEQRRRIFEPFFTTKPKGTGLGMAIVQRIVEAHGGHIEAHGSVGKGAEIIVELPRAEA